MARLAILTSFAVIVAVPAAAQRDWSTVEITTEEVRPGIYMLQGAGGNIGLSVGADGAFLIDDQFAPLSEKISAAIAKVTDKPVEFLINTHWHGDHTGGNENFRAGGAVIVAQDNVRKRLKEGLKRETSETAPAPDAALPIITFNDEISFYWNGEDIRIRHPRPAHTDGDAIVFFETANVVHMGDVYFNGGYPFIDILSGGDLEGSIAAQEAALSLMNGETRIIPGHGPLATKKDLEETLAVLKDVRNRIRKLMDRGLDEDAIVKADPLKDLNPKWGTGFINGEAMTRAAYRSLSKK